MPPTVPGRLTVSCDVPRFLRVEPPSLLDGASTLDATCVGGGGGGGGAGGAETFGLEKHMVTSLIEWILVAVVQRL